MFLLSSIQVKLLSDLVAFKQLTIPQFARLNPQWSNQTIRRALYKLHQRRKPLIKRIEFNKVSHFGKLNYVHSISIVGLEALKSKLELTTNQITFTPENPKLTDDYFHRVSTIDFHIFLHRQASEEGFILNKCYEYFLVKKQVGSFLAINKIWLSTQHSIIPDLVFLLSIAQQQRLFLFELHNGNDKTRIKEQIKQHALCLTGLYAHKKYKIQNTRFYYILLVFEKPSVMKAVIKDLSQNAWYMKVAQFFLFRPLDMVNNLFLHGWIDLNGRPTDIKIK